MFRLIWCLCLTMAAAVFSGCSPKHPSGSSYAKDVLEGSGWARSQSPYMLRPGQSITVCDTGVKRGVLELTIKAVRTWLEVGGRDDRLNVRPGCDGDRVIELVAAPEDSDFYGRASPLRGNVHKLDVPPQWAGHWTANHEVGHVFGFAHNWDNVSIMNSAENGKYMNGGYLSDYDKSEVEKLLADSTFREANQAWRGSGRGVPPTGESPTVPSTPRPRAAGESCIGVNGIEYEDGTVTTYKGEYFTCRSGSWVNGGPVDAPRKGRRCLGADEVTYYDDGVVTTYRGGTYTCRDGSWIRG